MDTSDQASAADRSRILTASEGLNREAFTAVDWALFMSISLIWGSSFLLMAIGYVMYFAV